jgi:hypothetical protein
MNAILISGWGSVLGSLDGDRGEGVRRVTKSSDHERVQPGRVKRVTYRNPPADLREVIGFDLGESFPPVL